LYPPPLPPLFRHSGFKLLAWVGWYLSKGIDSADVTQGMRMWQAPIKLPTLAPTDIKILAAVGQRDWIKIDSKVIRLHPYV